MIHYGKFKGSILRTFDIEDEDLIPYINESLLEIVEDTQCLPEVSPIMVTGDQFKFDGFKLYNIQKESNMLRSNMVEVLPSGM